MKGSAAYQDAVAWYAGNECQVEVYSDGLRDLVNQAITQSAIHPADMAILRMRNTRDCAAAVAGLRAEVEERC